VQSETVDKKIIPVTIASKGTKYLAITLRK
jgi:hypothetical protein